VSAKAERMLVVIPAFNESGRVGAVVSELARVVPHADLIVVDDGSTDATASEAAAAGAHVLRLPFNLGYGGALQTGYKYAVRNGYSLVAQIDADGQHLPGELPLLLEHLQQTGADVVVGSRFLDGEGRYRPSAARKAGMALFARIASIATRQRMSDVTSGFQVMRTPVAEFFCGDVYPSDYPDADIIILLHRSGFRIDEVPVRMLPSPAKSMHSGHRSLYYVYKMILSIFVTILRGPGRSTRHA
jgi:glycosyltransferase involved in cell wall biosynthesis